MEQRDPRDKSKVGSQRCQYQRCPRLLFCLLGYSCRSVLSASVARVLSATSLGSLGSLGSLLPYKNHLQLLFALLCRAVEYARYFIASIIRAVENKTL